MPTTLAAPLDGIEACVASDVEDGLAAEILGNGAREGAPLHCRVVAEEVLRRRLHAT
jgi:hypothetical protein